jgi:hypothetical protein
VECLHDAFVQDTRAQGGAGHQLVVEHAHDRGDAADRLVDDLAMLEVESPYQFGVVGHQGLGHLETRLEDELRLFGVYADVGFAQYHLASIRGPFQTTSTW